MKIRNLSSNDIESMLTIALSNTESSDQMENIRHQLQTELSEIGDNRLMFGGVIDESLVAMVQIILKNADNDPEQADGDQIASIHNLQVKVEHQRQGIGQQMMRYVESIAIDIGKSVLTLGVDDTNSGAILLYHKLGYKQFKAVPGRVPEETCLILSKKL